MPTIKDVARMAHVSPATVSYVLNESAPVSVETRARVLAAVASLVPTWRAARVDPSEALRAE